MLDDFDTALAAQLDRAIHKLLYGDNEKEQGLYTAITRSTNWESFLVLRGQIQGIEAVRAQMRALVRHMNEPHARADDVRAMN